MSLLKNGGKKFFATGKVAAASKKCNHAPQSWNFARGIFVNSESGGTAGAEVIPASFDREISSGFGGFSHTRFGGPGEKTPQWQQRRLGACVLTPAAEL
jgi:hypothetical protein